MVDTYNAEALDNCTQFKVTAIDILPTGISQQVTDQIMEAVAIQIKLQINRRAVTYCKHSSS